MESFSKAVEQLASEKIEVRLGGIYTLERISRESPDDYWIVMETLTGFIREHACWKEQDKITWETSVSLCDEEKPKDILQPHSGPATDIAAVLSVIVRRDDKNFDRELLNDWRLDFRGCDLRGAKLEEAHLKSAVLSRAHLEGADLSGAHLEWAWLEEAHLKGADFVMAHLQGAWLHGAHLEGASLSAAHLQGACLQGAYLQEAMFGFEGGELEGAHLEGADLEGAYLHGANLGTAEGLVQDQIARAWGNSETILPQGLTRPEHWVEDP
jgi:hypothetical protein